MESWADALRRVAIELDAGKDPLSCWSQTNSIASQMLKELLEAGIQSEGR